MKLFFGIMKLLTALAIIAGIVFVVIRYGDKIMAWVKKRLNLGCCCGEDCHCEEDCCYEEDFCAEDEEAEEEFATEDADFEG